MNRSLSIMLFMLLRRPAVRGFAFSARKTTSSPSLQRYMATDAIQEETSLNAEAPKKKERPKRILSGVQPTGSLHLGNYLGAIKQWVDLSSSTANTECYFCVVDLHAITVQPHDPAALQESSLASAALYLAAGIDPKKSKIFIQSHVPAHSELTWLLSCLTPVSWLERMIQYKEKSAKSASCGTGLLTYPVLMAADILLYQATDVPVGEDQRQHLELARDIVRRFADQYGSGGAFKKRMKRAKLPTYPVFTEPTAMIVKDSTTARVMSLTDGTKKMSKSDPNDGSRINVLDSPKAIRDKIKRAKTDDVVGFTKYDDPDRPEATNLLHLYNAVLPEQRTPDEIIEEVKDMKWGDFKPILAEAVVAHLQPIQERYAAVREDPEYLDSVLKEGADAANAIANRTLRATRGALGFLEAKE